MKLSYRGVNYENSSPMLEVIEGDIGGTYRGQNWRSHYLRHIPEPAPVHDLKYRGVAYARGNPPLLYLLRRGHAAHCPVSTSGNEKRVESANENSPEQYSQQLRTPDASRQSEWG
jgi:hypothetical protein